MRIHWTIVIPVVWLIAAAVSGVLWGFSASWALLQGALAFIVAGALMLLTRMNREPSVVRATDEEPFAGYPEGHVLAGVPRGAVQAAQGDLRSAGYTEHDVLEGLPGEATLDADGMAHGTGERIERAVERLFSDRDDLRVYRDVLLDGNAVIRVKVEDEDGARTVTEVLRPHGGYMVNYFGKLMVQRLDAVPGHSDR